MLLSLLIPTLTSRAAKLARLLDCLRPQVTAEVEVVTLEDQGQQTTGAKRNQLLAAAQGDYSAFIDDDDLVHADYCRRILAALHADPRLDAVGLLMAYRIMRQPPRVMAFTTEPAGRCQWQTRPIGHLCPTRTAIARKIGYLDRTQGEDIDYSRRLQASRLLTRTAFLGEPVLYEYHYDPSKPRVSAPPRDANWNPMPCRSLLIQPGPSSST